MYAYDHVDRVTFNADGSVFIVTESDFEGKLYRMGVDQAINTLPPRIDKVIFVPQSPAFVVDYERQDDWPPAVKPLGVLRWVGSNTVVTLTGEVDKAFFAPDQPNFVITYTDKSGELRRKDDGTIVWQFAGEVDEAAFSADKTMLEVDYNNGPSVLYRLVDGKPITLTEALADSGVFFSPTSTAFVVEYDDGRGELRWTDRVAREPLPEGISKVFFSPDGDTFVVAYEKRPGELRKIGSDTGIPLTTIVDRVTFSPTGDTLIVQYKGAPGELRDLDSAAFERLADQVDDVVFSPDGTTVVVHYREKSGEVWDAQRMIPLTTINVEKQAGIFAPDSQRLVVQHTDGRVELLDLAWLRALGGDPASLLEQDLVRLACELPLASGLWNAADQAALDQKLGGYEPQACRVRS
jgi:WD40 repeat protein